MSLRRRATRSRVAACLFLLAAVGILLSTYITLPRFAGWSLRSIREAMLTTACSSLSSLEQMVFALAIGTVVLGLAAVAYGCLLLGRGASLALELAAQSNGLADALCLAGDNADQLERVIALLVPAAKHFSPADLISEKDRDTIIEILKKAK